MPDELPTTATVPEMAAWFAARARENAESHLWLSQNTAPTFPPTPAESLPGSRERHAEMYETQLKVASAWDRRALEGV